MLNLQWREQAVSLFRHSEMADLVTEMPLLNLFQASTPAKKLRQVKSICGLGMALWVAVGKTFRASWLIGPNI
jgi:hypothetical protein